MSIQPSLSNTVDIQPFQICPFCLRVVPIIILEIYLLIMFIKELIKSHRIYYDKLDKTIFLFSVVSISVDLISILFFQTALSSISYILKLVWTFPLLLVFMRFTLDQFQCSKWFLISVLSFLFCQFISILFLGMIQVRYALLILYSAIGICAIHQITHIQQMLKIQRLRKRQIKRNFQNIKHNQNEIELLDSREYEYKVLPNQFKYHIYLRKSFCIIIVCSLVVSYILLLNLQDSRNLIGQFLVVTVVQMLTPGTYFFFACANQWIIKRMHPLDKQREASNLTVSIDQR